MSTATPLITFDEFLRIPDARDMKQELVGGEIVSMPPADPEHAEIVRRILFFLGDRVDRARLFQDGTGYRIGENCLIPDASYQQPAQARDRSAFLGAPMVAIEVLSPGEDFGEKLAVYLDGGTTEVWIVNYWKRTMIVFSAGGDRPRQVREEYHSEALGVTITLGDIFG